MNGDDRYRRRAKAPCWLWRMIRTCCFCDDPLMHHGPLSSRCVPYETRESIDDDRQDAETTYSLVSHDLTEHSLHDNRMETQPDDCESTRTKHRDERNMTVMGSCQRIWDGRSMLRLVHGKLPRNCRETRSEFPCKVNSKVRGVRVGLNPTLLRR